MRRATHALIRIVGGFVLVWSSVAVFQSARERDLPALCIEIGFLLSSLPYLSIRTAAHFCTTEEGLLATP